MSLCYILPEAIYRPTSGIASGGRVAFIYEFRSSGLGFKAQGLQALGGRDPEARTTQWRWICRSTLRGGGLEDKAQTLERTLTKYRKLLRRLSTQETQSSISLAHTVYHEKNYRILWDLEVWAGQCKWSFPKIGGPRIDPNALYACVFFLFNRNGP